MHRIPVYGVQLIKERTHPSEYQTASSPEAVAAILAAFLQDQDREQFSILMLNSKNHVVGYHVVTQGTLNASLVHPREVFKAAILAGSASIILAHNHPSGDPRPSSEDLDVTKQLTNAGKILGIDVLDHIIIGCGGAYGSLKAQGYMG